MAKRLNKQNPERNRDRLASATDEQQQSQIRHLTAEEAAKDTRAIEKDEKYVWTNSAIRSGVIWA